MRKLLALIFLIGGFGFLNTVFAEQTKLNHPINLCSAENVQSYLMLAATPNCFTNSDCPAGKTCKDAGRYGGYCE